MVEGFVSQGLVQHAYAAHLGVQGGAQVVGAGERHGAVAQFEGRVHGAGHRAEFGVGDGEGGLDVGGDGDIAPHVPGAAPRRPRRRPAVR
ncbi:hypothetical protein GCM10020254_76270 [Streptomyces goshikiensis]